MANTSPINVTSLLLELKNGNEEAFESLAPLIYQELRQIASRYLKRESGKHTIQTTDLVHEAYLRLVDEAHYSWENRAHFFAVAARAMRQFLIYYAKYRKAAKRGGGQAEIALDEGAIIAEEKSEQILALDEALSRLKLKDERMSRIVELRYFSGLTIEETAEVLSISTGTVRYEWTMAKAWLHRELQQH